MSKIIQPLLLSALTAVVATPLTVFSAEPESGVKAYINGNIYTGSGNGKYVRSLIIEDGKFNYVGKEALAAISKADDIKVIDLKGKTVVPGLYDSHIHPVGAGEKLLFECNFSQQAGLDEILSAVEKCAATIPAGNWIQGGSWGAELLNEASAESLARLDRASAGRPVILTDFSHHNIWANSEAIRLSGATVSSTEKYGDLVVKTSDGSLSGFFLEQAGGAVRDAAPSRTANDYKLAAQHAINELNKVGIIGVKDSYVFDKEYKAWKQLDDEGKLTANVALSWGWPSASGMSQEEKQAAFLKMTKPSSGHLNAGFAKMSLDGIPPTKTAAMLAPYNPAEKEILGTLNYSEKVLATTLIWLDEQGYTTQVHAVGDRAARTMLNAVEKVRKIRGNSGLRHEIAHACIVDPADIPRFAELDVIPNFSPIFWYPSPIQNGLEAILGKERATRNCEMKTLSDNGSNPTGGSDWPVSADVNPWKAMESMVTRKDPNGLRADETLWPEQRVTIEQALKMYTINGAMAQRIEKNSGSIEVGKSADMLILNQNIFTIAPEDIGETQVIETLFEGKTVYKQQ
ncbi:amidohydrolase [Vibrio sp. SCSIO 43137]|uniref:amidohydrolase n=1 Tax=Vibrio sp. SCSIO 43137 TaxID=3021011 RepID=UPI002306F3C5|nr:amidohydrolase [Vibrio sp. SCSIO 43137]WCE32140.1 amidohydrolase [Vibrio sp. SCSIO 43137]